MKMEVKHVLSKQNEVEDVEEQSALETTHFIPHTWDTTLGWMNTTTRNKILITNQNISTIYDSHCRQYL